MSDVRSDWPLKRPGDHMEGSGRWFNGSGEPIYISASMGPDIQDCTITNNSQGVIILGASNIVIENNYLWQAPPLDVRFADFCRRLDAAQAKYGVTYQ